MALGRLVFGMALLAIGVLLLLNHHTVDRIDRRLKAGGTTQRPEEIEFSDSHVALRQASGLVFIIAGTGFAVDAVW